VPKATPVLLHSHLVVALNCLFAVLGIAHLAGVFLPAGKGLGVGTLVPLAIQAATILSLAMRTPPAALRWLSIIGNSLVVLMGVAFLAMLDPSVTAPFWALIAVVLMLVVVPLLSALSVFLHAPRMPAKQRIVEARSARSAPAARHQD
jgi:hypothetical protein